MRGTGLFLVTLLVAILSGCASQPIPPTYYLLRADLGLQSGELRASKQFSLGDVEIAAYLDQPGLVMAMSADEMRPASQNLWAEPIYDGVRNLLSTEIARNYGKQILPTKLTHNTTVINVRIDQLHGTRDGQAQIVAYWWQVRDGNIISLNRFSESRALTTSGYSALVDTEKALLTELATKIAASMTNSRVASPAKS